MTPKVILVAQTSPPGSRHIQLHGWVFPVSISKREPEYSSPSSLPLTHSSPLITLCYFLCDVITIWKSAYQFLVHSLEYVPHKSRNSLCLHPWLLNHASSETMHPSGIQEPGQNFPGGAVVKNPPANAGDTGSSPGPGRSHRPWSN